MSIYSGFCTRKDEEKYNKLLYRTLGVISKELALMYRHGDAVRLEVRTEILKLYRHLEVFEGRKYLPPRFSLSLEELAMQFGEEPRCREQKNKNIEEEKKSSMEINNQRVIKSSLDKKLPYPILFTSKREFEKFKLPSTIKQRYPDSLLNQSNNSFLFYRKGPSHRSITSQGLTLDDISKEKITIKSLTLEKAKRKLLSIRDKSINPDVNLSRQCVNSYIDRVQNQSITSKKIQTNESDIAVQRSIGQVIHPKSQPIEFLFNKVSRKNDLIQKQRASLLRSDKHLFNINGPISNPLSNKNVCDLPDTSLIFEVLSFQSSPFD